MRAQLVSYPYRAFPAALRCRAWSIALLSLFLIAGLATASPATTLKNIRYSTSESRTRVVLDLSAAAAYSHRSMTGPDRVVVEIPQGTTAAGVGETGVGNGFVKRVRVNHLRSTGTLQVVLDLERGFGYKTFALDNPPRLVVDVVHAGKPAAPSPPTEVKAKTSSTAARKPADPPAPVVVQPPRKPQWMVAIDAGHGGEDHGARHHKTSEKDITLALAKELQNSLEKKGIRSFLVRKGDYYIPLHRRWTLAEKQEADLFVSLHCNASKNKKATGTEVFFLSLEGASDAAADELAERENAVDELMGVHTPESDLDAILLSMVQSDVVAKSQILAEQCLDRLYSLGTVHSRGVKQAGFTVLKSPRMPSVLVEAAFISNKGENKLLNDKKWRERFGQFLAEGIQVYIEEVDPAGAPERDKAER